MPSTVKGVDGGEDLIYPFSLDFIRVIDLSFSIAISVQWPSNLHQFRFYRQLKVSSHQWQRRQKYRVLIRSFEKWPSKFFTFWPISMKSCQSGFFIVWLFMAHPNCKSFQFWVSLSSEWVKMKHSKIYSTLTTFFDIPKTYLYTNFQDIWSKNEKALGILKVSFFQNSGQNAVLLPVFNLNFRIAPNREHVHKIWADASYQKI